jgi:stress response protein YsnF
MVSDQEMSAAIGGTAYGADGGKLGMVEAFYADDRTGAPTWVSVSTGLFGTRHSIVPAQDATFTDGALHIPVTADAVKRAPLMKGEHLDPADEEALRRHYGMTGATTGGLTGAPPVAPPVDSEPENTGPRHAAPVADAPVADAPVADAPGEDAVAAPTSDGAMTRSEEQLRVGTERVAATRARLVKYVVTEDVQITVPVRREEIRVEQVPLDAVDEPGESLVAGEAVGGTGGGTGGGLPGEIILHTERPVVTVEVVPVERVRLRVDVVEGQETVTEQVQREQIAVDEHAAPAT